MDITEFFSIRLTSQNGRTIRTRQPAILMNIEKKIFDDHKDAYYRQCPW